MEVTGTTNEQTGIIIKKAAAVEDWRNEHYDYQLDRPVSRRWLLYDLVNSYRDMHRLEANMLR